MQNIDEYANQICDFIIQNKIKTSDLHNKIINILEERSKNLPNILVLYTTCYGGFCLHENFINFVKENCKDIKEDNEYLEYTCDEKYRKLFANYITSFGEYLSQKYELVYTMLYLYLYYKNNQEVKEIYKDCNYKFDNEEELKKKYKRFTNINYPSFFNCVEEHGENNIIIWLSITRRININFMKYILKYILENNCRINKNLIFDYLKQDGSVIIQNEKMQNEVFTLLGLIGASGNSNCCLKIAEIPALLEFRISEYDGLEGIDYV